MFETIIEQLRKTDKEIHQLKHEKAQAEMFLALVVSQVGEFELDMTKLRDVNSEEVRLKNVSEDRTTATIYCERKESNKDENLEDKESGTSTTISGFESSLPIQEKAFGYAITYLNKEIDSLQNTLEHSHLLPFNRATLETILLGLQEDLKKFHLLIEENKLCIPSLKPSLL